MQHRITVNGVEYDSPADMPADVRRMYEELMLDRNNDGVPDVVERLRAEQPSPPDGVFTAEHIVVNGKRYDRIEDVPPELRKLLESARSLGVGAASKPFGFTASLNLAWPFRKRSKIASPPSTPRRLAPGMLDDAPRGGTWIVLTVGAVLGAGSVLIAYWIFGRAS